MFFFNKRHIQEHLEVPIDTSKMTEQELQFHYFKMHDADNNNKLDGCELIKSLIHWHGKFTRFFMFTVYLIFFKCYIYFFHKITQLHMQRYVVCRFVCFCQCLWSVFSLLTEQGSKEKQGQIEEKIFRDDELVNLIDPILNVDDANKDGYIDYPEFIRAQQKAAAAGQKQGQH